MGRPMRSKLQYSMREQMTVCTMVAKMAWVIDQPSYGSQSPHMKIAKIESKLKYNVIRKVREESRITPKS